jgi:general secretion pathway protein B
MSFILDALRKSEHERQRQTGPALAESAVAVRQPRSNVWATAAIALLLVNLVVVGVVLIRKAGREPVEAVAAIAAPASSLPALPATSGPAPPQTSVTRTAPAPTLAAATPPPMLQPADETGAVGAETRNPLAEEVSGGPPMLDAQMAAQASAAPAGPPAVTRVPYGRGSVVYESLPDSATLGAPQYAGPAPASSSARSSAPASGSRLPTADEVTASGAVPALNLDLHVYSTKPAERLVFINSRKYREGDTLQEGPVVRQITPDGAILEFRGSQFLLTHN